VPASATLPPALAPTQTPTAFPTPYAGTLTLTQSESFRLDCRSDAEKLPSAGFEFLAFAPTGDCRNGELGLFSIGANKYVAQSGLFYGAYTLTDVTDPTAPQIVGVWAFTTEAHTLDLKPFRQGDRHYLALALQRNRQQPELPCGIVVVEVTNVRQPKIVTQLNGRVVGASDPWCNVHTLEIDTDAQGNATYFIVSDVDTFSARAVDVRELSEPREVNFYHLHAHPHTAPNSAVLNYVHDSFIAPDKLYLANWLAGVVILDKQKFEAGIPQEPRIVKPVENVSPGGFHVHSAVPTTDGAFLFVQDELNADNGIRLLDLRDPENIKTVWTEKNEGGVNAPHNFVIRDDLLFVGWYNDGVKVFRFDLDDPAQVRIARVAFQEVRANKNISRERYFDGVWGVRVDDCEVRGVARVCVYASDMSAGLVILALRP
jgi:hypothetical protein